MSLDTTRSGFGLHSLAVGAGWGQVLESDARPVQPSLSLSRSLSLSLFLSLSLSHTHTHTHTRSLSLAVSFALSLSLSLSGWGQVLEPGARPVEREHDASFGRQYLVCEFIVNYYGD